MKWASSSSSLRGGSTHNGLPVLYNDDDNKDLGFEPTVPDGEHTLLLAATIIRDGYLRVPPVILSGDAANTTELVPAEHTPLSRGMRVRVMGAAVAIFIVMALMSAIGSYHLLYVG